MLAIACAVLEVFLNQQEHARARQIEPVMCARQGTK
jgi:hypothetical protein